MSFPPNSPLRGCAANFPQPINEADKTAAKALVDRVFTFNCKIADHIRPAIEYRSSSREEDILRRVFRWDLTGYEEVFENGFQAKHKKPTRDNVYYNLDSYVRAGDGGRPLDSRQPSTYAFISTTLDSAWYPNVPETVKEIYRYEIYAPGGIWVAQTLLGRYPYKAQDEVCFVAGIAPQYIRSAQRFMITAERPKRVDNEISINGNFDPQSEPSRSLRIERPIFDYLNEDGETKALDIFNWRYDLSWYSVEVANCDSYITAAFRSSRENEAYLFMKNEYVLLNYSPGSTDDKLEDGPLLICDGFPSLAGTAFTEHGIDCAFGSQKRDQAFIFSGNLCALINYTPGTSNDKFIKDPMTIKAMFPFLGGTVFESGIDAAFKSTATYEAYLFKDKQFALINYDSGNLIHQGQLITNGFSYLSGTIFESGIDAAFASHKTGEAYLFKGDSYACINFDTARIMGVAKKICDYWPPLKNILPRKNRGLDVHSHVTPPPDNGGRDQDKLGPN